MARARSAEVKATPPIMITENLKEALAKAVSKASGQDLVLVTGSLFVVGEARSSLIGDGPND